MDRVRIEGDVSARLPRAYVTRRLTRTLDRLPVQPVAAHVTFDDVNDPKAATISGVRCS
jgi:hypothetical protein